MGIVSAALILFFVMDPLGNIPVFSTILGRVAPERRRVVLGRELLISLVFLLFFLFAGQAIMELLSLKQDSIRVGGGMVLFLIALRLIFPPERGLFGESLEGEPLVFPLAVPLIAGPSSFAAILLLVKTEPARRWEWLLAVGCAWVASALLLSASQLLLRMIGRRGLMAIERLTGMLLVMISVQMVLEGVRGFLTVAKG